jgi:glycosidase
MMEFHISRDVRDRYQFAETLFSFNGNVVFANLSACREFAQRMNVVRDAKNHPERQVRAGALYAMGLIDEASHVLMEQYRKQFDPAVMTEGLEWLAGKFEGEEVDKLLLKFVEQYPGIEVYRGKQTPQEWLAGSTDGVAHREVALEEMVLLWMANRNPAFQPFVELFDDTKLAEESIYREATKSLPEYFATRPLIPVSESEQMDLLHLLLVPALSAPDSLQDQLAAIRAKWTKLLGDVLDRFLMVAGEVLREEDLAIWTQFNPAWDPARLAEERRKHGHQWGGLESKSEVPVFGSRDVEYEKFSQDVEWMPQTVLMAKSTYVWLAQLSRFYGRHIDRLDQIPDEELDALARRGFTGLWLIGLWERSRASKTIKQMCGNADAVASAYSLYDYRVADDLGGWQAYENLKHRASMRGIRLASDMVANHMGIDSPWVVEHPEWFLSRWDTPYPNYSFDGPDLSCDGRVEIQIEKHYYDQTDAAVVFRRRDRSSGEVRYIYHGNDGTSFPWNDTAQLDYLNPAVREHLIQTILHVARMFPIIRFDAAMTLAKRHFHRLWFPGPGASGAIPSRAEYGLTDAEFDRAMPHEFWREVVDRVAAEVPGTLLLAEAFWLMEGYFVRTLGMHRVYNSAFMNMLRDEENAKYRSVIKNTIEFDPDILKRYVNFMSNPDERTAIDQFGSGDKCFGVATMMATLPGLPMFGHGQIEGFTEKYGMEYRWPRYEENPNSWLVERHEREIAPLLHRRWLFAESSNFLLYDLYQDDGSVNEDVFAYSNRNGNERALVIYHNRYGETEGTIHVSAAYADKGSGQLTQRSLRDGLQLETGTDSLMRFRDASTGLEYLRRTNELVDRGFRIRLGAYECHAFLDWQQVYTTAEKPWGRLCDYLQGRGVSNLEEALLNLELQPVHAAMKQVLRAEAVRHIADMVSQHVADGDARTASKSRVARRAALAELWGPVREFLEEGQSAYRAQLLKTEGKQTAQGAMTLPEAMQPSFHELFGKALQLAETESLFAEVWPAAARRVLPSESPEVPAEFVWAPVLACCAVMLFSESLHPGGRQDKGWDLASDVLNHLRLKHPLAEAFEALGMEGDSCWRAVARIRLALRPRDEVSADADGASWMGLSKGLWTDREVRWLLGWNEWQEHYYIAKEPYEELLWWLLLPDLCRMSGRKAEDKNLAAKMQAEIQKACREMAELHYQVDGVGRVEVEEEAANAGAKTTAMQPASKQKSEKISTRENSPARRGKPQRSRRKGRKHHKKKSKK